MFLEQLHEALKTSVHVLVLFLGGKCGKCGKCLLGNLLCSASENSYSSGICQVGRYFLATVTPKHRGLWLLKPPPCWSGTQQIHYIKCILELIIEGTTVDSWVNFHGRKKSRHLQMLLVRLPDVTGTNPSNSGHHVSFHSCCLEEF